MKTVTIQYLRLKNFKGVTDLSLKPEGQDISIFGKNASGKTTIQDAFYYLLFGKDSQGKADFQLKPVSADGQEIHKLETEVEAVLDVDGTAVTLMKIYKEKWTAPRGKAAQEFTGHTTEHFIGGVQVKKKDYDQRIGELIDINAFKLVTSPFEFANLHWQARRDMLLEMCGDVSDQDVVESDAKLYPLTSILNGVSVDNHRAKVKASQKKINEKLKEIPARIAENQEMVKDAAAPNQKEKDILDKKLADEQENLRQNQNNEAISAARVELNEINAAIIKDHARADEQNRNNKKGLLSEIDTLEAEKRQKNNELEVLKDRVETEERRQEISKEAVESVRERWHHENAKTPKNNTVCPTCGQDLPQEQIDSAVSKFNVAKADRIKEINKEGKQLSAGIEQREKELSKTRVEIQAIDDAINGLDMAISDKQKELSGIEFSHADTEALEKQKDALESKIDGLLNGTGIREKDIIERISEYHGQIDDWKKQEAEHKAAGKARGRITDLEAQEKALAAEYEALEKELYLTDLFIVRKVEMLEDAINSRFKLARFKLFETQINGGLKEVCEILYQGVPYDRALNSAARVNVGLDIIQTLSEHFNFSGPVWVDNRESVTDLIDVCSQVISLSVNPDYETITWNPTEIREAS